MILPLSLDGDLHVRAPWHADLVVRARGADVDVLLPRRRDLWRLMRSLAPRARSRFTVAAGDTDPGTARLLSFADLFALRLAVSVRGHRVAERDASTGARGPAWKPLWRGVVRALLGRRRAAAPPAG